MGLLVGVGMMVGALIAVLYWVPTHWGAPETILHASTAQSTESFAIATGPIDEQVEGVFMLDFLTGELTCWVISPRTGKFCGVFRYINVPNDLQVEKAKTPKYLLATGQTMFRGGRMQMLGNTVLYVADANTGMVGAYGVPWDRPRANAGGTQAGALVLLDGGKARRAEVR
jgi:hypothetical protein